MNIYDFINNTYISKNKEMMLEVGDEKQAEFYPQVKFKRWDNEANLSVRLLESISASALSTDLSEKIIWQNSNLKSEFYYTNSVFGDSYEFNIILDKKPLLNTINFSILTKGLTFHYQPPLTLEEILEGANRPDEIVGSYAVFYNKSGDYSQVGSHNYRHGKFGHILRPKIVDSSGKWVWGDLNISMNNAEAGTLTVTIPWDFLKSAEYPIYHAAGLTFGYNPASTPGSSISFEGDIRSLIGIAGAAGTGVSMSVYASASSGPLLRLKGGIYVNSTQIFHPNSATVEGQALPGAGWRTVNFVTPPTFTAVNYDLCMWGESGAGSHFIFYDTVSSAGQYDPESYGNPWPAPPSWTTVNHQYAIYVTYTVSTTAPPTTIAPTTVAPTTPTPTTLPPTTLAPTTLPPTTIAPTTLPPTTIAPTTPEPTTLPPTTLVPTTIAPTTLAPTTIPVTTLAPTTLEPTTPTPTTVPPTTIAPTTLFHTTVAPTTLFHTTLAPTTIITTTLAPTTPGPFAARRRGIKDFGFSFRDRWRN